jgi:hypothetical protein
MIRRLLSLAFAGALVVGCSSAPPTATPGALPTVAPTVAAPTTAPTVAATPASTSLFSGLPYTMDLPAGWTSFDLSDPAAAAGIDAFIAANPEMGPLLQTFKSLPNVLMAVNQLLGNVIVSIGLPTGGLPLDTLGKSFTSQFAAVPGVKNPPQAEELTLPIGPALHWTLEVGGNNASGGTFTVLESIYLVENGTNAVLVEFVDSTGAGIPQESQIIQSLHYTP